MKNSVIFKFIAVVLCAVSLLGMIGSAAGIFVLTEADLYNKTVDQVVDARLQNDCDSYAHAIALKYASQTLGGCPEVMAENYYENSWFSSFYTPGYYGYQLLDAEGNVLESLDAELADNTTKYTFPVTGQYMHLVSLTPVSHADTPVIAGAENGDVYLYDVIPEGGTIVEGFTVTYADNSSEGIAAPGGIGDLYHDEDGYARFCSFEPLVLSDVGGAITHILFYDAHNEVIYEVSSPNRVGFFNYRGDDCIDFFATISAQTIGTAVYSASFFDKNNNLLYELSSSYIVGYYSCDEDGYVSFQTDMENLDSWTESGSLDAGHIYGIRLTGQSGNVLYELYGAEPVGFAYPSGSDIIFVSSAPNYVDAPEPAAIETIPEATVAPTIAETAPEAPAEETAPPATEAPAAETIPAAAETTVSETVPSSASAPEETEATAVQETAVPEESASAEATEATEVTQPPTVPPVTEAATEPPVTTIPEETIEVTEPVLINGKSIDEYGINTGSYYDYEIGEDMYAEYVYVTMPEYTVEISIAPGALRHEAAITLLRIVRSFRNELFLVLGISVLLFAICAVYLCCAAGHKPKREEIHAGGLNCLPLDLYLGLGAVGITGLVIACAEGGEYLLRQNILVGCVFAASMALLACLICVGFCFAFVAQIKTPGGYWWRNTLCGHCIRLLFRFCIWLKKFLSLKFFPFLGRVLKASWALLCSIFRWLFRVLKRGLDWLGEKFNRFLSLLPLTWQWLICGMALFCMLLIACNTRSEFLTFLCLAASFALILYGSYCFGILAKSAKRMSKGDLDTKVADKLLLGCFKDSAADLNALADVAVIAAQKQLKSERMKTELITNVSHDIKTPLTSIINYVDLLQKPHTDEEQEIYLEVLDRQSHRLKKLIDDLMEMSKASTGNMAVEVTKVDAVESINQALGEFADKLEKAQLTPVFRHAEESAAMMADGRLVWRVMSNLLSNAVKYALPGTRLYIDLMSLEGKVVISLKNISRDELNVDAEELMERFVRGDDSRNTEGSGLGLNIAKSLMELQKGQLQLLVDGDLFKVTLIFPGA